MVDLSSSANVQLALAQLPPDVRNAIGQAQGVYAQAAPLLALSATFASGKTPSEGDIFGGLASSAGAVGGPLAGAAMATAGGLIAAASSGLQQLFQAFGWYGTPAPEWTYVGLRRQNIDDVPPSRLDPLWWRIGSVNDLQALFDGRVLNPAGGTYPAISGNYNPYARELFSMVLQQLCTAGADAKNWPRACGSLDPFEAYLLPLVRADLEMWANGMGYVPTRELLQAAMTQWNATHGPSPSKTYNRVDYGQRGALNASVVSRIIGAHGDLSPDTVQVGPASVTVNLGPYQGVKRVAQLKGLSGLAGRIAPAQALLNALKATGCSSTQTMQALSAFWPAYGMAGEGYYGPATASMLGQWLVPGTPVPPPCPAPVAATPAAIAAATPKPSKKWWIVGGVAAAAGALLLARRRG